MMDPRNGNGGATSRAERFEDEKRRIVDSCFSKKDVDGSLLETYITHIKITEYSTHPTSPPPPEARNPQSEKPRVIIVAVRKSGRVRMHKSKENSNGTFSIGKTWDLNDLTGIESFTASTADAQKRQWAGDTGFTVNLGKPYFWQAQADKEKKFFVASLIKIFGKYTGGKLPDLVGFDARELDQVLGSRKSVAAAATGRNPPPTGESMLSSPTSTIPATATPLAAAATPASPPPPQSILPPVSASTPAPAPAPAPAPTPTPTPTPAPASGSPVVQPYRPPPRANPSPSRNLIPPNGKTISPAPSLEFSRAPPPGSSSSALPPPLRRGTGSKASQESFASFYTATGRNDDTASIPPRSRSGLSGPSVPGRFADRDTTKTPPPLHGSHTPELAPSSSPMELPDRRRPPMDPSRPSETSARDLVPAPLMNPTVRRDPPTPQAPPSPSLPSQPPPRSLDRLSPRKEPASQLPTPRTEKLPITPEPPSIYSTPNPDVKSPINGGSYFTGAAIPTPTPPLPASDTPAELEPKPEMKDPETAEETRPGLGSMIKKKSFVDVTAEAVDPVKNEEEPGESRPGLGPMIKTMKSNNKLANALWKAASAATTFKPRPGGAAQKLRELAEKTSADGGPDGITEVVPAPPRPAGLPQPESPPVIEPPPKSPHRASNLPQVKVTVPGASSRPNSVEAAVGKEKGITTTAATTATTTTTTTITTTNNNTNNDKKEVANNPRDTTVVAGNDARYLTTLGIDTSILSTDTAQFTKWLDFFGFVPGDQMRNRNYEEMELDIDRQLHRIQAGGWVARFEEQDERIEAIKGGLDDAMAECDELDNLLTLYSVELSTLSEDIAFIEAQGQGLQVQAANQKLLKTELESLLEMCAIQQEDLEPLNVAPLDSFPGLEDIESTLVTLYRAMMKIDPSVGTSSRKSEDRLGDSDNQSSFNPDYGKMRVVYEKREMYTTTSSQFLLRLGDFMKRQFDEAALETKKAVGGALTKKVNPHHHETGRDLLWRYSPLMVYVRDLDNGLWDTYIHVYSERQAPLYTSEFREVTELWKRAARKPSGDDEELLFTAQVEKQHESTMTQARKLTVKRSQTLAKSLRSPLSESSSSHKAEKTSSSSADGRSLAYEVFAGILDSVVPLVEMEQNFIVDFFHATTLETTDFPDVVAATKPRDRRGGDLTRHRLMEPDRELARRVTRAMETIFVSLEQGLQGSVDWVLSQEPLQGVGVLASLERQHAAVAQTSQEFLNTILQKLHATLETRFVRFVDEQIRAIEETKVKIKKRKGVISFTRVFPHFSAAVENMMIAADANSASRRSVDREYNRIVKSMFDSLKVIARENPATLTSTGADPEDKEALNFHILLIENMNHFLEEVDTRGLEVLEDWHREAENELAEHMGLYIAAVMRRPLGKLLEFLENIETQLASGKAPLTIAAQPSNAKATFNKILSGHDGKEVRKGVEALKKRVEKHFADDDHPSGNGGKGLVMRVLRECDRFYGEVEVRISTVTTRVYDGDVLFEWPRAEVKGAFAAK